MRIIVKCTYNNDRTYSFDINEIRSIGIIGNTDYDFKIKILNDEFWFGIKDITGAAKKKRLKEIRERLINYMISPISDNIYLNDEA